MRVDGGFPHNDFSEARSGGNEVSIFVAAGDVVVYHTISTAISVSRYHTGHKRSSDKVVLYGDFNARGEVSSLVSLNINHEYVASFRK